MFQVVSVAPWLVLAAFDDRQFAFICSFLDRAMFQNGQ